MNVYQAPIIKSLLSFYGDTLHPRSNYFIHQHLSLISIKMYEGLVRKEECLYTQINNYNPNFIGNPISELKEREFSLEECQHTISNEYGFKSWEAVLRLEKVRYNSLFENCVDAIISGDKALLQSNLEFAPSMIHTQSQYGHGATLLHYVASNGIELWRQQVPYNLAEITKMLVEYGAKKDAKMNVYGGEFTPLELLTSSAHPYAAGIAESIIRELQS